MGNGWETAEGMMIRGYLFFFLWQKVDDEWEGGGGICGAVAVMSDSITRESRRRGGSAIVVTPEKVENEVRPFVISVKRQRRTERKNARARVA